MTPGQKRIIPLIISFLLLAILFWKVDLWAVIGVLRNTDPFWFVIALIFFLPQTVLIALRWQLIVRPLCHLPFAESTRQILASNALNLLLPSKLGDLAKGVFLYRQKRCRLEEGMQIVVFEKLLDLAALSAWMLLGWLLFPSLELWVLAMLGLGIVIISAVYTLYFTPRQGGLLRSLVPTSLASIKPIAKIITLFESGPRVRKLVRARGDRQLRILSASALIWLFHLLQIHFFFLAVGASMGIFEVLARMPIAIFAGLLPLTIAGVGTRDWAIIAVFAASGTPPEVLAAGGLLVSLRYVVPALGGLPFMGRYFGSATDVIESNCAEPAPARRTPQSNRRADKRQKMRSKE